MSKKICTFFGMREVIDMDFGKNCREYIRKVIEENKSVEFWFFIKGQSHYIFLNELLVIKSQYPEKEILIKRVFKGICSEDRVECINADKDSFRQFVSEPFDDAIYAEPYSGKDANNENAFLRHFNHTIDWYLKQCNVIFLYCYPQLRTSETSHIEKILKKDKEIINLTNDKTAKKILRYIGQLSERERFMMKKAADGCRLSVIAKELNLSLWYVSARIQRKSMEIINKLEVRTKNNYISISNDL